MSKKDPSWCEDCDNPIELCCCFDDDDDDWFDDSSDPDSGDDW